MWRSGPGLCGRWRYLLDDLHLLFPPLGFVLLGVDEELDDLLLELVCGV